MQDGLVLVDIEAPDFASLCHIIGDELVTNQAVTSEISEKLTELWQKKHRHQFEGPRKAEGKLTSVIKELLVQKLESKAERSGLQIPTLTDGGRRGSIVINDSEQTNEKPRIALDGKVNVALQKKISSTSEAAIILEGSVNFLDKPQAIFVKLKVRLKSLFDLFYLNSSSVEQNEYPQFLLIRNARKIYGFLKKQLAALSILRNRKSISIFLRNALMESFQNKKHMGR